MELRKEYFIKVIEEIAQEIEKERDYLTELDSQIGDGDHGINLSIGFRAVSKSFEDNEFDGEDIAGLLKKVGMTLLSKVGGASGPLYGSFFMQMGRGYEGKESITFENLLDMLNNGVTSIENRGKAELGDKTMVDVLRPSLDLGLDLVKENEISYKEIFDKIVERAEKGSDETIPMQAKKGRALRLKERSIGHRDPGSASSVLILKSFNNHL